MNQSPNRAASGKGENKRSRDDDIQAVSKRLRKDNYPKDGAKISAYPHYDTTRDLEAKDASSNSLRRYTAVEVARSRHVSQHAEVVHSHGSLDDRKPTSSPNTPALPGVGDDQLSCDPAGSNTRHGQYKSSFGPTSNTFAVDPKSRHLDPSTEANRQRWLKAARMETPISRFQKNVYVKGIEPSRNVSLEQAKLEGLLLPEHIWALHSLTPAQRVDRIMEMTDFAAMLSGDQKAHASSQVWQRIYDASDSLKRGESEWYHTFQLDSGNEAERKQRLEEWQVALHRDNCSIIVSKEDILRASQIRKGTVTGSTSQWPVMPVAGKDDSDNGKTLSLSPKLSASSVAASRTQTPLTEVSDLGSQLVHPGRKRPISDDSESSKSKKARSHIIDEAEQRYYDNKSAIDYWWRSKQRPNKSPWFEKLKSWEYEGSVDARTKLKDDVKRPVPVTVVQTRAMESPEEILHVRKQWRELKPHLWKHPKDKVNVAKPEWPSEDSIAVSAKRPDGKFDCMHVHGNFKCCREGLTEDRKKNSISKQIRIFKCKVEELIMNKDLHIAHKTWNNWLSDKKFSGLYSGEMARINALLTPVNGHTQPVREPTPPSAPQTTMQQHTSQPPSSSIPPVPSQSLQGSQKPNQIGQRNDMAGPQNRPAAQKRHEMQQVFTDAPDQAYGPRTAVSGSPVGASHELFDSSSGRARMPLKDESLRQQAVAAISSQREKNTHQPPVIVAGVNLAKEDYRNGYEEVLQKIIAALKHQESRKGATTVLTGAPVVAQNTSRHGELQKPQVLPPSIVLREKRSRNEQVTLQSMHERGEETCQGQPALSKATNVSYGQAPVQLPRSAAETNHVIASEQAPHKLTASRYPKAGETSTSSSKPETSFMPASHESGAATPAEDHQQVAMRMVLQLIKDRETIVLPGLKVTREDVSGDMNGCVRKIATALKSKYGEATQSKTEEFAQFDPENDTGEAKSDDLANHEDELEYLFNDEVGEAADNNKQHASGESVSLQKKHDASDLNAVTNTHPDVSMSISASPEPETNASLHSENQEDDLEYLNAPEAWYIEDPFELIASIPYEMWQQPSTFTLDDMSYFDLDKMMPSDLQDRLRRIKSEREQKMAQGGS